VNRIGDSYGGEKKNTERPREKKGSRKVPANFSEGKKGEQLTFERKGREEIRLATTRTSKKESQGKIAATLSRKATIPPFRRGKNWGKVISRIKWSTGGRTYLLLQKKDGAVPCRKREKKKKKPPFMNRTKPPKPWEKTKPGVFARERRNHMDAWFFEKRKRRGEKTDPDRLTFESKIKSTKESPPPKSRRYWPRKGNGKEKRGRSVKGETHKGPRKQSSLHRERGKKRGGH